MKKIFTLLFVFSALLIACSKVEMGTDEAEKGTKEFHIRAISEDVLTKTTYELTDGMYNFSWHSDDNIGVQMIKKADSSFDMSLFTNSSSAGPDATFSATGSATHSLGNYAFYPCRYPNGSLGFYYDSKYIYFSTSQTDLSYLKTGTAVASQAEADAAAKATVRLYGTITEDAANPMRHIPLIGIRKGETTDFSFKAATGVLKLTLKSLPATATQICLDAIGYALNGYFVFDTNGEIKESYKKEGYGQKYMNITTSGDNERAFYFPIPTGTIPAGKLTVSVSDGSNTLYSVKNTEDIALVRGQITEMPVISIPSVTVKFSSNHQATIYFSGDVKKVSWTTAQNSVYTTRGNQGNYVTTSGTVINLGEGYPDSGIRYFGYSAYNNSDATKDSEASYVVETHSAIPYYNPGLSSSVIGSYSWKQPGDGKGSTVNTHGSEFGATLASSPSITFAASDNISKGNIVITNFCGKTTRKVYGFYKDSANDLIFGSNQCIFIENGVKYYIREYYNDYVRLRLGTDMSVYNTTADMYCQGDHFYVYHGSFDAATSDYDISYFLADRNE